MGRVRRARLTCFTFRTRRALLIYNARLLGAVSSLLSASLRFFECISLFNFDVCLLPTRARMSAVLEQ